MALTLGTVRTLIVRQGITDTITATRMLNNVPTSTTPGDMSGNLVAIADLVAAARNTWPSATAPDQIRRLISAQTGAPS